MNILQKQVGGYLKTRGYGFPEITEDFLVADIIRLGGIRDTQLIWVPIIPERKEDFPQLRRRLLREFEERSKQYPDSTLWLVAEGFGPGTEERERFNIHVRAPVEFFDTPFKYEERPKEVTSKIKKFLPPLPGYIPQPYSILMDDEIQKKGDDLGKHLLDEFRTPSARANLRIVVGPAGIGKTWLFRTLFSRLYADCMKHKKQQLTFPRPIPLTPEYLREAVRERGEIRTEDLVDTFISEEIEPIVPQKTFEWLVMNGYAIWLFDGLDELYAGDPRFFEYVGDFLMEPGSQAQILICARDSLLKTCERLTDFLHEYGTDPAVRLYRLDNWEGPSKRAFAHFHFAPPKDSQFLAYISRSDSLKALSTLPYYCNLLRERFGKGKMEEFTNDFDLIGDTVSKISEREEEDKGTLKPEYFESGGLRKWLEYVAAEIFTENFKGIDKELVKIAAEFYLYPELSEKERRDVLTALVQFPLFAPGLEPEVLTFKHELIAEYLAGCYWLPELIKNPEKVADVLGNRLDLADSLIGRYMASQIARQPEGIQILIETLQKGALRKEVLPGKAFTNLLQLLLLAAPAKDLLNRHIINVEGRDLSHVRFIARNLEGYSFRNSTLFSTVFEECNLQNAHFEGSKIEETRFKKLSKKDLKGIQLGNLEHDFISGYVDRQRTEDPSEFRKWLGQPTVSETHCPAALQLRTLFLKFVRPDGTGKRTELPERALSTGKRHPGAPTHEACVKACISFGYLQRTRYGRVRRVLGDRYNDMIYFVKDRQLSNSLRKMLDSLCSRPGCVHVPKEMSK